MYLQVPNQNRKHAGTGLGLIICRGIIEAHGGKIWVDNTCKTGAAIKFTLPVRGQEDKGERFVNRR